VKEKKHIVTTACTILCLLVLYISYSHFKTFANEVDANNVYYIFSTGAQTLAALVGFVLTVYIFSHQNFRNIVEDDETLAEIIEETIDRYYDMILALSIFTALTLIGDLLMLQLNKIESWPLREITYSVVAMANVIGIIAAFCIGLYILRPFKPKLWATNILKSEEKENVEEQKTIRAGDFIEKFIEFEKLLVKYTSEKLDMGNKRYTLRNRLEMLLIAEKIDPRTHQELLGVVKLRNLVVHGQVNIIEKETYNNFVKILTDLKENLK